MRTTTSEFLRSLKSAVKKKTMRHFLASSKADYERMRPADFFMEKSIAYLRQVEHLVEVNEISSLTAGRSIVIKPNLAQQPTNKGSAAIEETIILSITRDIFKEQGDISQASKIIRKLIAEMEAITISEHPKKKRKAYADAADKIKKARDEINQFPDSPNRDKLNIYLHTLEFNLREYEFLQKAGVYYFGEDPSYAELSSAKLSITKETLASVYSIAEIKLKDTNQQLFRLTTKKKSILGYLHIDADGKRQYIAKESFAAFLQKNSLKAISSIALNAAETKEKKDELKKIMAAEMKAKIAGVDTLHKVWVNAAPSNNPYAHALLMLSKNGQVIGYVHVNAFNDILSYIPKDEFNAFLMKHKRTVMGVQKLNLRETAEAENKLMAYVDKKWLAAGFFHNCADFTNAIARDGGVPYLELNPDGIKGRPFINYPINSLASLAKLNAIHSGSAAENAVEDDEKEKEERAEVFPQQADHKLQKHIATVLETFAKDAKNAGIPQEKREVYVRERHITGCSPKKAKDKVHASSSIFSLLSIPYRFFCRRKTPTYQTIGTPFAEQRKCAKKESVK